MTSGERIKGLRIKNNISQKTLSHDLGYKTYTTISKWESDASLPPGKELKKLAEYFQVSTDYILGLDDDPDNTYISSDEEINDVVYLEAAYPHYNPDEAAQRTMKVPNYILREHKNNYFVINVYSDSVNRVIPNGNKIVVLNFSKCEDCHLKTGDIILVKYKGEFSLKYLRKTDTMVHLEPRSTLEGFSTVSFTNKEFEDDKVIEVIGKVIYTFRNFT